MATPEENLSTSRANLAARLAEITANPKPSYTEGGEQYDWLGYQQFLLDGIERLDRMIASAEGPFEMLGFGS